MAGELLERIKAFAEEFADRNLSAYLARLTRPGEIGSGPKEINDAVWGTVKISPLEVVVIDSPLVQRLRLIRQLGVVHWVYPGASHSRFEHTLGVLHQAQRVITAINQASIGGKPPVRAREEQLIRLCAIMHDVGHGVFSHVSEHALARRVDLRLALVDVAEALGVARVQLSELIAHHVVGSQAFGSMLELAFDSLEQPLVYGGGSKGSAKRVAELIQKAIIGHRIDDEIPLLHEIITGPFDADKLDYYVRDAQHAGVPSVVDISRLLQKIVHRRIPMKDVPEDIKRALPAGQDGCELFGLKASGASMLDELHLARVLLYAKIYRQKKVLAIEGMIDALFSALGDVPGVDPIALVDLCYAFSDDHLVVARGPDVMKVLRLEDAPTDVVHFVDDLLVRLRDRNLYATALSLLPKYPDDPWQTDKPQTRGLLAIATDCANPQRVVELRQAIAEELTKLCELVPDAAQGIPAGQLRLGVVVSAKPQLSGGTEIDRALILQGDRFVRGRDLERMSQPAWSDAYHFGRPHAMVFAPRETAQATFVAAERLVRMRYGVVLPPSAIELSKQDPARIEDLKFRLEAAGWYSGVPMDIRPQPRRLTRADIADRIRLLATRFEAIDEPRGLEPPRRAPAMENRIRSWLAQFRDDLAIEGALDAIERMRILSRDDSEAALLGFVERHPEFRGATIVPLGDLKDSGSVQAYLSRDLEAIFPRVATVEAAAAEGDRPIVFVDDFVGSGTQVRNMLGSWFDDDELKEEGLREARLGFNEREQAFLRSRPVGFVFVSSWKKGLRAVAKATEKVGIEAVIHTLVDEAQIPFAFDGEERPASSRAFEEAGRAIGESLLAAKSDEKKRTRALGYGNRAMLLASRLNVPTQTLTCIWMDGIHDGVDWHALIRRRGKS